MASFRCDTKQPSGIQQSATCRCISSTGKTEFWSTESIGIAIQPCLCEAEKLSQVEREEGEMIEESCTKSGSQWVIPYPWKRSSSLLPDNRQQAIKRLEATKRERSRNLKHAEAYRQQMKEMVQMNFARKISTEKAREYRGPVHYQPPHGYKTREKEHSITNCIQFFIQLPETSPE